MPTSHRPLVALALAATMSVLCPPGAEAQRRFVNTGDAPWPDAMVGPAVPYERARPGATVGVLRSARAPVAVHLLPGVSSETAERVLRLAERLLDRAAFSLHLEAPAPDGALGGGPEFDLYLRPDPGGTEVFVGPCELSALWDRAPAWALVSTAPGPVSLEAQVADAVARAVIASHNADHTPSLVDALASTVARQLTLAPPRYEDVLDFTSHPERSMVTGGHRGRGENRGASLFFDALLRRHDDARHTLLGGLLSGTAQKTPATATTLFDEPDTFDLLQRVFRDEPGGFAEAMLNFGAGLRTVGTAADPEDLAGVRSAGLAAPPTQRLGWASLPSWSPLGVIENTGVARLSLDLSEAPNAVDGALTVAVWVHLAPWYRWQVALDRTDGQGRTIGSVRSPVITDGQFSTELTGLERARTLEVTVINLGALDFDPDVPVPARGFGVVHLARSGEGPMVR